MRDQYERFFERYGSKADRSDITIRIYLQNPEYIDEAEDVAHSDKNAAELIEDLESYIEALKKIRGDYQQRYMYLETAATKTAIRLRRNKRYYDNKVYYYLEEITTRLDDKKELVKTIKEYPGTERRTALADFEAYKKSHPGIEAIKDIAKSRWEK